MPERSSRSAQETGDREAWLTHLLGQDPDGRKELGSLLATAQLVRGVAERTETPEGAEEEAHRRALEAFHALRERAPQRQRAPRAPWFTALGSAMRYVFTLGRRR
jgi:hypothetical protein